MNTTHISHIRQQVPGNCRIFKLGQTCVWADPAPLPHTELRMCVPCQEQQPTRTKCSFKRSRCRLSTMHYYRSTIEVHFVFYFPCWFSVWGAKIHSREGTPPWQQELLLLSACADWDRGAAQLFPGAMQVMVGVHVCSSQGSLYLLVQKCKNIWW